MKDLNIQKILFKYDLLFALDVKDGGYECFSQYGEKYYMNTSIAIFKMIEWAFDTYGIYLCISLGEDSYENKWYECSFKHNGEIKSFYDEKNYKSVENAIGWMIKNMQPINKENQDD